MWLTFDENAGSKAYDSSYYSNDGTYYGNTRLLLHFDEGSGSTAEDESPYSNDGTIHGATWTTGKSGHGLQFDGDGDYVNISDSNSLDIGTGDISLIAWVKTTQTTTNRIVSKQQGSDQGYLLFSDDAGKLKGGIQYPDEGTLYQAKSTESINDGKWHHVTLTIDRDVTTGIKLFIDGKEATYEFQDDPTPVSTANIQNSVPLRIGARSGTPPDFYFNGTIDEVAIYSKALTAEEIQEHYEFGRAKFADWVEGKLGKALSFDGVDDYVDCGSDSSLDIAGNMTVEVWIKTAVSQTNHAGMVVKGATGFPWTGWQLQFYNNKARGIIFDYSNNAIVEGTTVITDGSWHHIVLTDDGSYLRLYVDSIEEDYALSSGVGNYDTTVELRIGRDRGSLYFNGTIDEVRIYNRALSEEEIINKYLKNTNFEIWLNKSSLTDINNATKLLLRFEDNSSVVRDWSGNNNICTLGNSTAGDDHEPAWVTGKLGYGLEFDGVDDYVDCGGNPGISNAVTFEFWVNPTLTGNFDVNGQTIIAHQDGNGNRLYFFVKSDGTTKVGLEDSALLTTGIQLNANEWVHIAVTAVDGTYKTYKNGVLMTSGSYSGTWDASWGNTLQIAGVSGTANTAYFNGTIDEVRIYNRSLTEEEIKIHYYAGINKLANKKYNITLYALDKAGNLATYPMKITVRYIPTSRDIVAYSVIASFGAYFIYTIMRRRRRRRR